MAESVWLPAFADAYIESWSVQAGISPDERGLLHFACGVPVL